MLRRSKAVAEPVEATIKKSEVATKFTKCLGLQELPRVARNDKRGPHFPLREKVRGNYYKMSHSFLGLQTTHSV